MPGDRGSGGVAVDRSAPASPPATEPHRVLPAWPFTSLFVLYPLWWGLGLSAVIVPVLGAVAVALMTLRGRIRLPPLWLWWASFLAWSLLSVVMIDSGGRLIGFVQRWVGLLGATLLVLYVLNAPERLPRRRVLRALTWMFGWVIVGGYLGMLLPQRRVSTLALALLPTSLTDNPYVLELLSPRFAEVQHPYAAETAFVRPSAPFPYTNAWGHAFVLLVPVLAALAVRADRRTRWRLAALAALAVPPALATLNRGIVIGLAVTAGYVAVRRRRQVLPRQAAMAAGAGAVLAAGVAASGALGRLADRTSTSSTTADRATLYREAFDRTLQSPLIGWGAPRPSATRDVSVGTQGQLWYVMFSHGFVGLALYLGFVWGLAVVTREVRDLESTLLHAVVVCVGVMLLFYGVDDVHLVIAMTCGMLLLRPGEPDAHDGPVGHQG